MSLSRLEALQSMIAQDPGNSFVRYGLAQAMANAGQYAEAVAQYRELIALDRLYVAAYFHGGQTLEKAGDLDAAREIYLQGLDACVEKGDMHTRSEIQAALDILGY
jgi:tetratricopeptide (TPR) repeat protein